MILMQMLKQQQRRIMENIPTKAQGDMDHLPCRLLLQAGIVDRSLKLPTQQELLSKQEKILVAMLP